MATILLVDDVELFLEIERSFLEDSGHRVYVASSGEEALDRLAQDRPDLMLLDLHLPGIDGDEVCRRVRASAEWRALPLIMVTAAGKEAEIRKCLAAGCDDYLTKPVKKQVLVEKVQRLLGQCKNRQEQRSAVALKAQLKGEGRTLSAAVRNLSSNGIYVKSRNQLDLGTMVELQLELSDGRQLRVLGKVKRVQHGEDGGMGIYFIHPQAQEKARLEELIAQGLPAAAAAEPTVPASIVQEENQSLRNRIAELEAENREFAERIVRSEEVNNNLTNLYVASSRLHAVLDRAQVVEIVKEVIINLVGAEKFALLLFDREASFLHFETGEGFADEEFPVLPAGTGLLGRVATAQQSYYVQGAVTSGSDDPEQPLAAIPLVIQGRSLGVLAIYRLLVQKERFEAIDYQLFSMLAGQAATALFSSTLYQESERKRQTYRGFMDLLLQ